MLNRRLLLMTVGLGALAVRACFKPGTARAAESFPVMHSEAEWREILTPDQFAVLREAGTEYPYTSPLLKEHGKGDFACAGCDQKLFSSETKFESGTGWPSFWQPLEGAVGSASDTSHGMDRTEVHCSNCGGHLGHVFTDGPPPTGLRYCMNGIAMKFIPAAA
jgi:peptide-methionine (R)-S-oxide reductase